MPGCIPAAVYPSPQVRQRRAPPVQKSPADAQSLWGLRRRAIVVSQRRGGDGVGGHAAEQSVGRLLAYGPVPAELTRSRKICRARALRWGDIDWHRGAIRVTCPKLEHIESCAYRTIPLFPELREHLLKLFTETPDGVESDFLISVEIELALISAEIMPSRRSFWPESADACIRPRSVP